ncbi:MAG: MFS transporter [Chloroflexota bacterium]|nr:MFS transporter [Chloroflexota bacterium]
MPTSSRRTLLLIAAVEMIMHGVVLSLGGPTLPSLMETFALQEARAGLLLASTSAGFLIGTLGSGFLIDREGLKRALLLGQGVEALALGLYALAPAFPAALAAGLLLGFAAGIIETALNTLPARMASQRAGSLMNLIHLFFSLGAFAAPLTIGALLQSGWAWRSIYGATIVPALGLGLTMLIVRFPSTPPRQEQEVSTWSLLRQRPVILGALVLLFYVGAEMGVASWIVLYLQRELNLPIGWASAGLSTFWVAMMVGRYGNSRLALHFAEHDLVVVSGLGGAICSWGLLTTGQPLLAFVWLVLAGLLFAGIYPLTMASVNSRYPQFTGRVSGLLAACAAGGSLIFPPLLGAVAQGRSLRLAMSLNGVWMMGVALSFAFMPRGAPVRAEAGAGK